MPGRTCFDASAPGVLVLVLVLVLLGGRRPWPCTEKPPNASPPPCCVPPGPPLPGHVARALDDEEEEDDVEEEEEAAGVEGVLLISLCISITCASEHASCAPLWNEEAPSIICRCRSAPREASLPLALREERPRCSTWKHS